MVALRESIEATLVRARHFEQAAANLGLALVDAPSEGATPTEGQHAAETKQASPRHDFTFSMAGSSFTFGGQG